MICYEYSENIYNQKIKAHAFAQANLSKMSKGEKFSERTAG